MMLFLKLPFDQNARMINYKRNDNFKSHHYWMEHKNTKETSRSNITLKQGRREGGAGRGHGPPKIFKKNKIIR
jgi:hypothetical protein